MTAPRGSLRHALAVLVALTCLLCIGVADTPGCGKTPTLTNGRHTMTVNSKNRQWILRLPQGYDNKRPYKLMFGLHWLNADFTGVDTGSAPYYGLKALDRNNSIIFVAPDGLNKGWANAGGEDVTFIDQIMEALTNDLCINEKLVFSMGFSYGAAMSYALACARPKVFRAVALMSGNLLSGCSGGTEPVAYYAQHGVHDGVLNINGGHQLRDRFVKNNGCTAQTPREPARGGNTHIQTKYQGCSEGHPVWWTAFDGDHVALPTDQGGQDGGPRSWTCAAIWEFFSQFS